jgi:hypothetical protein
MRAVANLLGVNVAPLVAKPATDVANWRATAAGASSRGDTRKCGADIIGRCGCRLVRIQSLGVDGVLDLYP